MSKMANISISTTWNGEPLSSDFNYQLQLELSKTSGDVIINVLDAPLGDGPAPDVPPGRVERLHEHDVVEIFIAGGEPPAYSAGAGAAVALDPYLEVQLGPHGHYFLAFFMRPHDWATQDTALEIEELPECSIDRERGRWSGRIIIPSFLLPQPLQLQRQRSNGVCEIAWRVNACAIITTNASSDNAANAADRRTESSRIFAMQTPCGGSAPDFHRIDCCQLLTLEEAPQLRGLIDRTQSLALERINTLTAAAVEELLLAPPSAVPGAAMASPSPPPPPGDATSDWSSGLGDATAAESVSATASIAPSSIATSNSRGDSSSGSSGSSDGADSKSPVQHAAEQLRNEFHLRMLRSAGIDPAAATSDADGMVQLPEELQLEACFQRHVHKNEFVIMHGMVTKRKGMSYKSRRLILTSLPRLLYFNAKGLYKGNIAWPTVKGFKVEKIGDKKFDITLHDKSRTYHFTVNAGGAEEWVDALQRLLKAQRVYLRASLVR